MSVQRRRARLLCVYQHAPTPGAPGIYRHRLYFAELVRRGWHVDLVSTPVNYMTGDVPQRYARRAYLHERIDGIDMHWVWAPGRIHSSKLRRATNYTSFAAAALARAATLRRPDVALVSSPPLPVAALGPLLARRHRVPWVLEVRDIWPESAVSVGWLDERSRAYRALLRLATATTSRASAVIVPTPGLVERVRDHGARSIEVIPGPVVDEARPPETRHEVRQRLRIADGDCVFLYLGAIGVANGIDMLLDAVALLPRELPASLLVVGDGSGRRTIENRLAGDDALRRVRILDPVPKDEVFDLLAASDVCLHLLRPDPVFATALPSKMLDYFSAHRPFITTAGGLPATLAAESGGEHASDAGALADAIVRWTRVSGEERARAGERSYTYGAARFGITETVDRLERLLRAPSGAAR
jgi:glycosyltransferase involved in cell wall biosynthesis